MQSCSSGNMCFFLPERSSFFPLFFQETKGPWQEMFFHLTGGWGKMDDSAFLKQNQNNNIGNKETAHPAYGGESCHKGGVFKMVAPAWHNESKRKWRQQKTIFIKMKALTAKDEATIWWGGGDCDCAGGGGQIWRGNGTQVLLFVSSGRPVPINNTARPCFTTLIHLILVFFLAHFHTFYNGVFEYCVFNLFQSCGI